VRKITGIVCVVAALMIAAFAASSNGKPASQDNANSIVIVFKDGHQQTFPMGDVARIEFTAPPTTASGSWPAHFVGKWKVGVGDGMFSGESSRCRHSRRHGFLISWTQNESSPCNC